MNVVSGITNLDLTTVLDFEGTSHSKTISVKKEASKYTRISDEDENIAYLGWLQGEGYGNLLMLGVLQEVIKMKCSEIHVHVPLTDGSSGEKLMRFYSQFGITHNTMLSKKNMKNHVYMKTTGI